LSAKALTYGIKGLGLPQASKIERRVVDDPIAATNENSKIYADGKCRKDEINIL